MQISLTFVAKVVHILDVDSVRCVDVNNHFKGQGQNT